MILTLFVISIVLTINPISITLYTSRNQTQEESTKSKIETPQPSYVNVWLPNGTVICTTSNDQHNPQICSDGAGGAIITWQDNRSGNLNIYAQKVNSTGNTIWTDHGVAICAAIYDQYNPQICGDGAGGAIITWCDYRDDGSTGADIYAQWVSSTGNKMWGKYDVAICTASNNQFDPQIYSNGGGGAIITWHDYRSGSNYDIYAQRVSLRGTVHWNGNGTVICNASSNQFDPQICGDGGGGAIITWRDYRSGSDWDIYAQRVNIMGTVQWTANGIAICAAIENQRDPQICDDGGGGAIITWADARNSGLTLADIFAQKVDPDGDVVWTPDGVAISTAYSPQQMPQICSDGSGGAIITWDDYRSGNSDIYAQLIDSSGTEQWTADGIAICAVSNEQYNPQICSDGAGGVIITWQDHRSGNFDIYAQKINSTGNTIWTDYGVTICTAINDQSYPQICGDGAGGAIIIWQDHRGVFSDIYAQRIKEHPIITIKLPIINQLCNKTAPSFNISIVELNLDTMWYTIDGGDTNKNITGFTEQIDQTEWNKKVNGTVTIEFYANDTFGNIGSAEVTIHKDIEAPIITIINPDPDQKFKTSAPLYDLFIDEGNLDKKWYTLDGGATNISITELSGKIDQTIWEGISDGPVTIRFYASDTLGHLGSDQVVVQKDAKDGQDGIALIIRNAIIYSTVVGVIGMTFWIIKRRMGKKER